MFVSLQPCVQQKTHTLEQIAIDITPPKDDIRAVMTRVENNMKIIRTVMCYTVYYSCAS